MAFEVMDRCPASDRAGAIARQANGASIAPPATSAI